MQDQAQDDEVLLIMSTTSLEQYLLELINEARLNPLGNAARYIKSFDPLTSDDKFIQSALSTFGVDADALEVALRSLTPVAPLAWNEQLAASAERHSAAMVAGNEQSHQLKGELDLAGRVKSAGYANYTLIGENIYAYAQNLPYAHAAFMVDWGEGVNGMQQPAGHRANIMSESFTEVGIDVTSENNRATSVGPFIVTQDFGSRSSFSVTGVAYRDDSRDNFYTMGEGVAGLVVSVGRATTTSGASGGYNLSLPSGSQTITLTGGGLDSPVTVATKIDGANLKLDVVNGSTLLTSGNVVVSGGVSIIKVINAAGATVTTGAGTQDLRGLSGNDLLDSGEGDDKLAGGEGDDQLKGGAGRDNLDGGPGNDLIDGGAEVDIAHYTGARKDYALSNGADGSLSISNAVDGTDILRNVEFLKFSDGQYSIKDLGLITNRAPTISSSQALTVKIATATQVTVQATDPDGDRINYTASKPSHGTVTGGSGGAFLYTPEPGYLGGDTFQVTASDGRGGASVQMISISIENDNKAPLLSATQTVVTKQETPKQINILATDPDGDTLTFNATPSGNGVVTNGGNGKFTYTPAKAFTGNDHFTVTVNDGHGHVATQTVTVQVTLVAPASNIGTGNSFRLFMANGLVDQVGGKGTIHGTNGFQDVALANQPGEIVFDASFARGGDIIRIPLNANEYSVRLDGSLIRISDGDSSILVPIGTVGTSLVFADGVRSLVFDSLTGSVRVGSQEVDENPAQLTAPSDSTALPTGGNESATGRVFLSEGGIISLEGKHYLFGSAGSEQVHYGGGDLVLDTSFNRGGDTLYLPLSKSEYEAYISGSTLILMSGDGEIFIPVGATGMKLVFAGEEAVLRFDSDVGAIVVGEAQIRSQSPLDPDKLIEIIGGGNESALDLGSAANAVNIEIADGMDHRLTEDALIETNVIIHGFDGGDTIEVTNALPSNYSFGTVSKPGGEDDLWVVARLGAISNEIVLVDAIQNPGLIYDLASAEAAVGHAFMTFG